MEAVFFYVSSNHILHRYKIAWTKKYLFTTESHLSNIASVSIAGIVLIYMYAYIIESLIMSFLLF